MLHWAFLLVLSSELSLMVLQQTLYRLNRLSHPFFVFFAEDLTRAGLKHAVLPRPPKWWDNGHVLPQLA